MSLAVKKNPVILIMLVAVILVRVSPEDAPNAYWSMIATALSLIVSTMVTASLKDISLLDAIVVTYGLSNSSPGTPSKADVFIWVAFDSLDSPYRSICVWCSGACGTAIVA